MLLLAAIALLQGRGDRDFYEILGLKHDCTDRDIEKAFMQLSRKYHPDKQKAIPAAFEDINDAYGVLRDANKRRVYDLWGEGGVRVYEAPKTETRMSTADDDISAQVTVKGETLRVTYPVDLIDFHEGRIHQFVVKRRTMCRCPDAGFFCQKCNGRPTIGETVNLTLAVERGADEGTVVVFKNAGDVSEMNSPGDVEVVLVSRPHPVFWRDGSDLHATLSVSLREALLGFKRELVHIDGKVVNVQSKDGLGNEKVIVVKNRGLSKYLFPGEFGDLYVHVKVVWPKNLDSEQKAKLIAAL